MGCGIKRRLGLVASPLVGRSCKLRIIILGRLDFLLLHIRIPSFLVSNIHATFMHHIGERAYKLSFSPFVIFPFSSFTRMFRPMQCTVLFRALPNLPFLPLYICFYVTSCSNLMVTVIRRIELLSELINILQHNILSGSLALQGLLQIHIPSCFLVNRFNLNNRNAWSVAAEIQEPQVLNFWSRIFIFLSN